MARSPASFGGTQLQLILDAQRSETAAGSAQPQDVILLDVREVAAALGCGRTLVFEMLAKGELPVVKLGRLTRVPRSALREFIGRRAQLLQG